MQTIGDQLSASLCQRALPLSLFLLAGTMMARAAEPPVTWDDCVGELIRNNPQLQAAGAAVEKTRSDVMGNYGPFLPQISANGSVGKSNTELDTGYQDSTSYQASLSAYQSLFAGFGDVATLRRSQALLTLAEINLQTTKAALSTTLRQSFARLLYAQDFVQVSEVIAVRRKENVNLVEMRFEAGRENKGSAMRSKAYYRQAQFEVTQAHRGLKTAQQQMAATLGRHEITILTVTGNWDFANLPEAPDFNALALQTPDYRGAAIQVRAAKEGVRIAKSDFYPTWSVNGSIGRSDDDSLIPKNDQWSVGTAISYPLFVGGQHWYGVRGAKADQRKAEDTLNDTESQMVATLEDRFVAWQDAAERTDVQNEFLKAAEVRAEIARAQYQNGLLSFEDWDLIENDLIDKQKSVLISQRDAVFARAGWEKTLGTGVIP
ncbi:MAG: TolC family protein [Verrucomicrobia bacterium]|nr:TolC family protein [Verrucomicrobiota bacterium]